MNGRLHFNKLVDAGLIPIEKFRQVNKTARKMETHIYIQGTF